MGYHIYENDLRRNFWTENSFPKSYSRNVGKGQLYRFVPTHVYTSQ